MFYLPKLEQAKMFSVTIFFFLFFFMCFFFVPVAKNTYALCVCTCQTCVWRVCVFVFVTCFHLKHIEVRCSFKIRQITIHFFFWNVLQFFWLCVYVCVDACVRVCVCVCDSMCFALCGKNSFSFQFFVTRNTSNTSITLIL